LDNLRLVKTGSTKAWEGIGRSFRFVWRLVNRPLVWSLIYLLLIPAFATIYLTHRGDFYQTSATHEASYRAEVISVINGISLGIQNSIADEVGAQTPDSRPPQTGVYIKDVASSSDAILINVETSKCCQYFEIAVPYDSLRSEYFGSPEGTSDVAFKVVASPIGSTGDEGLDLFIQYSATHDTMRIPDGFVQDLFAVASAQQGFVSGLPDQCFVTLCWRMIYFSAVVQTTLGFGDITPVSTTTRSLVTVQAVLGVVVIGLFLNALAARWREE
jgi:Ion channel